MQLFTEEDQLFEHLTAYCLGELSAEEMKAVEAWAMANKTHQEKLEAVKQLLQDTAWENTSAPHISVDNAWQKVNSSIQESPRLKSQNIHWYQVAAAAAVLLVCCWAIYFRNAIPASPWITAQIKDTLYLPDGSMVVAKQGAQLRYHRQFGKENREVELDGEAIFDVPRQTEHPFHLRTAKATITVLGTRFSVNNTTDNFTVKVMEGAIKASLTAHNSAMILKRGEMASYQHHTQSLLKQAFVDSTMLRYYNTPVKDIAKDLQATKQILLTGKDSLMNTKLTVDFRYSNIVEIKRTLELLMGKKVEQVGQKLIIQ
ncbi:FecR family protein [Chitinophaga pendula]|uniref:FecR family protein n=1 Tax=Chitinophaga TaxID=79328 RepID=UPI000BAF9B81|nr:MULTISPECIES: FecR family protein [Chitinophaga]ASZ11688.1 hypothetical protein CK934_12320 [Chitinophaga sp. MD30]UCJ05296.1 FecR family protein [Chitinophaga pendula]